MRISSVFTKMRPMHEVELKSVVDDLALRRRHVEGAGGRLRFAGTMMDRYYTLDTRPDSGAGRLRVRTYQAPAGGWTELTWKGSARLERGYKVREELNTRVEDETTLREILERTGFAMSEYITREIAWYMFGGASVPEWTDCSSEGGRWSSTSPGRTVHLWHANRCSGRVG